MRPAYILLFVAVAAILGTVFTLSARLYIKLGDIDTGQSSTALILGGLLALILIAAFITLAVKGRGRGPQDFEDR